MTQELLCLYGSQTGNSEQAAQDFCKQLTEKYTTQFFEKNGLSPMDVKPTCLQLDDFLEARHASFTKCLVIFVSSYGVGQAPLGAYKFRSFSEKLLEKNDPTILKGLQFAICGLGDSTYTTYLKNPTTIDKGLISAGAKRIGELAMADAHRIGENAQDKVIQKWVENLWLPLAQALEKANKDGVVDVKGMQMRSVQILIEMDPDYSPPNNSSARGYPSIYMILGIFVALFAMLLGVGELKTTWNLGYGIGKVLQN